MIETHYAGVTLDFYDDIPQYLPADGWTLKYALAAIFTSPVQATITLTATTAADGVRYRVQASSDQTALWTPGKYSWVRRVEKAGPIIYPVGEGVFEVLPTINALAQGYDGRSHARKVLDALKAAMEGRALTSEQGKMIAYTIGTRSQTFSDSDTREQLKQEIIHYEWIVAEEDNHAAMAAGKPNRRTVGLSFRR
jgi:hypothetical protein